MRIDTIRWHQDVDGVVVLTLDTPGQNANTMNADFAESFGRTVDRLVAEKDSITGVVLTSAKRTFFAGGDLNDLFQVDADGAERLSVWLGGIKKQMRRLETLGRPVVAAINGAALGGGLELALATHHRIAADVAGSAIGLPEVTLGLLPGAGGTVRTARLLGVERALRDVLLHGQRYRPVQAWEIGLVDDVVASIDDLLPRAKAWIAANPGAVQPWDVDDVQTADLAAVADLRAEVELGPAPAPRAILAAALEGAEVDVDTAMDLETRAFLGIVSGQVAKNMIKAFFFDTQRIRAGASRPSGFERFTARTVVVAGSGSSAAAAVADAVADAGVEVVLTDGGAAMGRLVRADLVVEAMSHGELRVGVDHGAEDAVGLNLPADDGGSIAEIIRGPRSSDATVAKVFDFALQIRRTPIVVYGSSFASRLRASLTGEVSAALGDGADAGTVEKAALEAGYPVSVIAELSAVPWPDVGDGGAGVSVADLRDRLLFVQALEAVRCFDEGVLASVEDANVGSILGAAFPVWTGGVVQMIDQHTGGAPGFIERSRELAVRFGDRFLPPRALVEAANAATTLTESLG